MNEDQMLMTRAVKAQEQIHQEEDGERFYDWLEKTFGIRNYEKEFIDNHHVARLEKIGFVWAKAEKMSAAVFTHCSLCNEEKFFPRYIGTINKLEELAEFIERDEKGNLYFDCGKHYSGVSEQ